MDQHLKGGHQKRGKNNSYYLYFVYCMRVCIVPYILYRFTVVYLIHCMYVVYTVYRVLYILVRSHRCARYPLAGGVTANRQWGAGFCPSGVGGNFEGSGGG